MSDVQAAVREKPILFSSEMVRAILDGRKSMTRRIVKFNHKPWLNPLLHVEYARDGMPIWFDAPPSQSIRESDYFDNGYPCPYGFPGERLWARETHGFGWETGTGSYSALKPTGADRPDKIFYKATGSWDESQGKYCWRPSIHMPRWASRLTLEITEVRVERVQDISARDIIAEGAVLRSHHCSAFASIGANPKCPVSAFNGAAYPDLISLWAAGWDKVNGKGAFERNDWVWVISFNRLEAQ